MLARQIFLFLITSLLLSASHAQGLACSSIFTGGEKAAVPVLDLTSLKELQSSSRGHFEGVLGAEKVFVKRLRGESLHEVQWLQYLNALGLGVKLFGTIKIQDHLYMVIEKAPGFNTQMPMLAPSDFIMTRSMVKEIRRQADILSSQGISPVDLQFQISRDGQVRIIDPELFRQAVDVASAQKETAQILSNIFMVWTLEGKIEL